MAKVILICGKICSGKSYYSKLLLKDYNAIVLSCDEVMSILFNNDLGEKHDDMAAKIKIYLHKKTVEIVNLGNNVILDWGFWSKAERLLVTDYYKTRNIDIEWHYIDISLDDWHNNITSRNKNVVEGSTTDYYVDEGLLLKLNKLFDAPEKDEMDVWYLNKRG